MFYQGVLARFLIGACPLCGAQSFEHLCSQCKETRPYTQHTATGLPCLGLGPYEGFLKIAIGELKFRDSSLWATHLGAALARVVAPPHTPLCLVPVPLHPLRLAERGYNQAALLARTLARETNIPIDFTILRRTHVTAQQAQLSPEARKANTHGAFVARRSPQPNQAAPALVLVDDVITTGHTVDDCARALQQLGWQVAAAWCCAITPHPSESAKK